MIDAHRHVWDTRVLRYPWLEAEASMPRAHLPGDAVDPEVDGAVFVQADADDGAAEAKWVQGLHWPDLRGIVAFAPVEDRARLVPALDELAGLPRFVGVRRLLQDEAAGFIESVPMREGFAELARWDVPFDACIRHWQLAELTRALRTVPGLRVVLDHLGKPPVAAGIGSRQGRQWLRELAAFAAVPGTCVKLSGLAPEAHPDRPLRTQVAPFLHAAAETFGPERLLIGSDWPVSALTAHQLGFGEWFALVLDELGLDPAAVDTATEGHYGLAD